MIAIYLSFSIITSTLIFAIFKWFDRFGVHNLTGIVVNYLVAFSLGMMFNLDYEWATVIEQPWFPLALFLGVVFISLFNVMARTSQVHGVSVASVATKMSLVIPVLTAFFLYDDAVTTLKIVGLMLALVGVVLVSNPRMKTNQRLRSMYLPILLFLGSGFIDAYIKFNQEFYLGENDLEAFITVVFGVAGLIGLGFTAFKRSAQWTRKNVLWGILLGVPNYGSMIFLLLTLHLASESSVIFPVNNMGIVALSALVSLVVFREPLGRTNWIGIGLSLLAIFMFLWPSLF